MLSRRAVLAALVLGAGTGLAGCASTPPFPLPTSLPRLPGQPIANEAQTERLRALATALDQARSTAPRWAASRQRTTTLDWALDVVGEQFAALNLEPPPRTTPTASPAGTPAGATPTGSATPSPTASGSRTPAPTGRATPSPAPSPIPAVVELLSATASAHRTDALADAERPLVWAAMSAWCLATGDLLSRDTANVQPPVPLQLPAALEPAAALNDVLATCHQAQYAIGVFLAAPELTKPQRDPLLDAQQRWVTLRDTLTDATRAIGAQPAVAAPWYDVRPPATAADATTALGRLQLAALPHLGVGIASGPAETRGLLADALGAATRGVRPLGALVPRWPGLLTQ